MSSRRSDSSGALVLILFALAAECIYLRIGFDNSLPITLIRAVEAGAIAIVVLALWRALAHIPRIEKDPKCL